MATTGTTVTAAYSRLAAAATAGMKVLLLDDSLTLDDSVEFVADVSSAEITGATNYARKSMAGEAYAYPELTGTVATWTALGTAETVAYAVAFVDTGSDATSWVVGYLEADPPVTLTGSDLTVSWTDDVVASYGESTDSVQDVQSLAGTGGYGTLGYFKDRGMVRGVGTFTAGTSGSSGHTLPSGYRPAATVGPRPIGCSDGTDFAIGSYTVTSAGVLTFTFPTGFTTIDANGVEFRAA